MKHNPTEEQQRIFSAATSTDDNLLLEARAGSAKTTTIEEIARLLPALRILYVAFNKRIVTEAQARMPENVEVRTLNSLGYRLWADNLNARLTLDMKKDYHVFSQYVDACPSDERSALWDTYREINEVISVMKRSGFVPTNYPSEFRKRSLVDENTLYQNLDYVPDEFIMNAACACLIRHIKLAFQGTVDFADQIYMPALTGIYSSVYDLVMIDEAQDFSYINHRLIYKIVKKARVIVAGDSYQNIYGFRGALRDSMEQFCNHYSAKTYPLSISFRCPKSVVARARVFAPDIRSHSTAAEGTVEEYGSFPLTALKRPCAIICRNNAPLFSLAFRLIQVNVPFTLANKDIFALIRNIIKKISRPETSTTQFRADISAWYDRECNRALSGEGPSDLRDTLYCLADRATTVGDIARILDELERACGNVELMTGHKAKGLEFNNVYYYDCVSSKPNRAEANVRYVIITRARQTLTFVHEFTNDGEPEPIGE